MLLKHLLRKISQYTVELRNQVERLGFFFLIDKWTIRENKNTRLKDGYETCFINLTQIQYVHLNLLHLAEEY